MCVLFEIRANPADIAYNSGGCGKDHELENGDRNK